AKTHAAATDQPAVFFDRKISPVRQQLSIDTERTAQRALDLGGPVVVRAQPPGRPDDQRLDLRDVGEGGRAQCDHHGYDALSSAPPRSRYRSVCTPLHPS